MFACNVFTLILLFIRVSNYSNIYNNISTNISIIYKIIMYIIILYRKRKEEKDYYYIYKLCILYQIPEILNKFDFS